MRINKYSDSRLFLEYETSKIYRKSPLFVRKNLTEEMLKTYTGGIDNHAEAYCKGNGITAATEAEKRAYWLKYNIRINDLLYCDFKAEYVSDNFYEAAKQNFVKLIESMGDKSYYDVLGACSGTMIMSNYFIQYAIQEDGVFVCSDYRNEPAPVGGSLYCYPQTKCKIQDVDVEKMGGLWQVLFITLAVLLLKKLGKVETLIVAGNTRRRMPNSNEAFRNQAPFRVTYLDCSWLRTIIRTEGFLVRGHFRLQACGERHLERKLIYIKPFQKHGYVRRAGRLIAEERAFVSA